MPARRKRRTPLDRALADAMKEARREKLVFERKLSEIVSRAIGGEAVVKLKKPLEGSKGERRVRKAGSSKSKAYYDSLELLAGSPNAPGGLDA